jgi:Mrp family chromosome partitioning ATPase
MSSLDQAFIKAYQRNPAAPAAPEHYAQQSPAADPFANRYADPFTMPQPATVQDAWCEAGLRYRIDAAHTSVGMGPASAAIVGPPSAYGDLAYSRPYYALPPAPPPATSPETSGGHVAVVVPASAPPGAGMSSEAPSAGLADPEPSPASPAHSATADAQDASPQQIRREQESDPPKKDTLQAAATLKVPAPLELPSIFREPDRTETTEETPKVFSPDWEVDHFSWPEICDKLLAAEATYFRHVGERLGEATARQPHVLMVTGCRRGEGRTTLALCLARCAAQAGVKAALLDADFQNPQLGSRLGMETPCGWSDVLAGKAPLHEAAVASVADHLTLFPLLDGVPIEVSPGDKRLIALVQAISAHYPLVVIDVGPLGAEERHPFAGDGVCPVNAAIVVRDLRYATERKAIATAQQLERSGIPAVGIAENFVEVDH